MEQQFFGVSLEKLLTSGGQTLYMVALALIIGTVIGIVLALILVLCKKGGLAENLILYNIVSIYINIVRSIPFVILLVVPKFAVITGASSGIGAEFARQLSARGYNLMLVARRADRLETLSDHLTTVCEIMTADLSKKSECLRLAKALEERRVDLFINNAGFGDCGPFLQTELDKDLDMLSVNIRAVHILTKKIGQKLYKQGFGALLNVGSCAGLMPAGPYMATYYATKAYVVSLTSALAQELKEAHSPVYAGCLCPGPVDTEFNAVANVEFALRGITPEYCVRCALDGIARRKTVIVPSRLVAAGMTLGRFLPRPVYIKIAAHQQKKKLYQK